MVSDELHQLGGVYSHIVECVEALLSTQDIIEITNRAKVIPRFRNQRRFKNGFFISNLTNPTYDELKDHMAIFITCVQDKIHQQAVACIQHYIDFYYLATSKEHTHQTLSDMNDSLLEFNKLSPQLAMSSKSNMCFPKNHALWRYATDIESRGVVGGYSTCQSETQHKTDSKLPARRSNFQRGAYTEQMAKFIMRRDVLYDIPNEKSEDDIVQYHSSTNISTVKHLYELSSLVNNGNYIDLKVLQHEDSTYSSINRLIHIFLDTDIEKRSSIIKAYKCLKLFMKSDDDNEEYTEIVRANPFYHNEAWRDFVAIKGEYYGQATLFFTCEYKGQQLDLCLVNRYLPVNQTKAKGNSEVSRIKHITGMEVLELQKTGKVIQVSDIERTVHIVPDYSHKPDKNGHYQRFLVNHDIDRFNWSENKGELLAPPNPITTWDDVEKETKRQRIKELKRKANNGMTGSRKIAKR
ncbi:hypothetical protein INT45_006337 [Circinella minor]|uniref:Uncharacterized protein n=1 Tax=Circinella minor TaxID=1195481 RepID=A0A8H7VGE1_9FUNG|nr:hypothetical protein INT45_006337 [Circinella minor]